MKKLQSILFLIIFILAWSVLGNTNASGLTVDGASEVLKYNKDIVLRNLSGTSHKLQDYIGSGRWLIVMIWASKCQICNTEISDYIRFHEKHKNKDATVLGISVDGWEFKEQAQIFINKHSVTFPNLIAAPILVDHLYVMQTGKNLLGTPAYLVYSPSGELKVVHSGSVSSIVFGDFIEHYNNDPVIQ